MNILFLSEYFYPHGGGAEYATYLYAKLLSESGFNVIVLTNKYAGEKDYSKHGKLIVYRRPLFRSSSGTKYPILSRLEIPLSSYMRKLLKWASLVYVPKSWYSAIPLAKIYRKPTIVHVHDYTPICPLAILYNSSAHSICRNPNFCSARCIYQFEKNKKSRLSDSALSVSLNLLARLPLQKLIEQADAIVCVSKAQRNILIDHMPLLSSKTYVVYNPLPNISPVEIIEEDFGYLGGFNPLKGFDVLCHSLYLMSDRPLRVHVTGISKEAIRDVTKTSFLSSLGLVLHERLKTSEQENFYRRVKAIVFPSIIPEPLPYVTAEAIMRGRLLIASKIGGIPEQTRGCKGVFLIEPGNYRELAETLSYARNLDKSTILELAYHDRHVFAETFNNEKTITDFERIMNSLI